MGVVVRQSIKGTIANYFGVAIGFITTFFIQTKLLTAEEIGLVDVLAQAAMLFSGLAQLGTNSSAMRYYPYFKDEENKDKGFFGWTIIVPFIGFLIFLAVFFIFRENIAGAFADKSPLFVDYIYFVIPLAFFMLYTSVFETNSNLLLRIAVPKFIREVGLRIMLLILYLLYGFDFISLKGLVICFCASYGVAAVLNIIYLFSLRRVSFKIDWKEIPPKIKRDFLFYTLFMITSALAGNITPLLNKFFLAGKEGLFAAGIFTIAVNIAMIVEMPYRSLGAISRPMISEAMANKDITKVNGLCRNVALHQLIAGVFLFFIIWTNLDLFFDLLPNGNIYRAGKMVVIIIGMSRLLNSVLGIGATALGYSRYYYLSIIFTVFLTFSSIVLNILLIPIWGMAGAAAATLFSYIAYYFLVLSLINRLLKVSPFSLEELKTIPVFILIFLSDILWRTYISPIYVNYDNMLLVMTDAFIRTSIILISGIYCIYAIKVSPQINEIINKYVSKLCGIFHHNFR